jgi:hypothetical protein
MESANYKNNRKMEKIERVSKRFEIALSNFGRSCIDLQANEKAFQAWYASCIIQEFGLSHVYREIHLWKTELFKLSSPNEMTSSIEKGNELFPDLSVSWMPDVDTRHSSTREETLRSAGDLLTEFAIISELKVTGSTLRPTSPKAIFIDISKLFVFLEAHQKFSKIKGYSSSLRCYMVIFDNAKNSEGDFKKGYTKDKIGEIAEKVLNYWPNSVPKADLALISPGQNSAKLSLLKNLTSWIDF